MTPEEFADKARRYSGVSVQRLRMPGSVLIMIYREHGDDPRCVFVPAEQERIARPVLLTYCRDLDLPPGYKVVISGENEAMEESFRYMAEALGRSGRRQQAVEHGVLRPRPELFQFLHSQHARPFQQSNQRLRLGPGNGGVNVTGDRVKQHGLGDFLLIPVQRLRCETRPDRNVFRGARMGRYRMEWNRLRSS